MTINLLNALVWLAINLVNRLREKTRQPQGLQTFQFLTVSMRLNGVLTVNAWIIEGKELLRK